MSNQAPIPILCVDDHSLLRQGLACALPAKTRCVATLALGESKCAMLAWLLAACALFLPAASALAADAPGDPSNVVDPQPPSHDGAAQTQITPAPGDEHRSSETKRAADSVQQLPDIVVTGSRLPAAEAQSAQDVHIYDRPRIERSGQTSLVGFLNTLPEVSLNSADSTFFTNTVRLRGAQPGAALILINGRRTQDVTGGAATNGFFDINFIPLALVERIEVLPTGSSAIYGGDAIAGVINVVLKSNLTGVVADVGYKWADNTDEKLYSLGAGWNNGPFSVSIMGSHSDRSALFGKDRDVTASADYRRFGGPNLGTQFFGAPANVSSVSGNLPGLTTSFAAVPHGSSGIGLKPSDFAATAGTQNTGGFISYEALIPELHRDGVFLSANYRFETALEVFAELLASQYRLRGVGPPPALQLASVPASNAFNPFGTTVRVAGVVQGTENFSRITFDQDFVRPLVGARGNVGTWQWELAALSSRDNGSQVVYGRPNTALLNAALASSDPTTALNPFVDGPMASPGVLGSIYSNTTPTSYKSKARIVDALARGPLLQLPGGPLDVVIGGEYEHSTLRRGFDATRDVQAAFAELRAPIIKGTNDRGEKREVLAVDAAVRYDSYSDFGSKVTWQSGIEFRPYESVLLRGTHATAFKPPTLYQLASPPLTATVALHDPMRGGEAVIAQQVFGGNPELDAATGTSNTVGVVWSPRQLNNLNMSATWWAFDFNGAVNLPSPQYILDNESLYPGRVVRAPAPPGEVGQVGSVDFSYVNFGTMRESGVDGSIDWSVATALGDFTPAIAATYITKFQGASTPGAPVLDRLSRAISDGVFAPRWKGTASIAWRPNWPFKLGFAGRYIGRYYDYTPPRTIGDVWYFDATLEVDLVRALGMNMRPGGLKLLVSGTNLADKLPPYSTYFVGYDVYNYDLVGRTIFARLQLQL